MKYCSISKKDDCSRGCKGFECKKLDDYQSKINRNRSFGTFGSLGTGGARLQVDRNPNIRGGDNWDATVDSIYPHKIMNETWDNWKPCRDVA